MEHDHLYGESNLRVSCQTSRKENLATHPLENMLEKSSANHGFKRSGFIAFQARR